MNARMTDKAVERKRAMGLKRCKFCQQDIDAKASRCPHCTGDLRSWFGKHLLFTSLILLFIFFYIVGKFTGGNSYRIPSSTSSSKQWFHGGNLHNATIAEWKAASYQDKLATAADFLSATQWKGHLNSPNDFNKLKRKAQMLVYAIDKTVAGTGMWVDTLKVAEIAAAIITMANDLGP